ncbi:MAG: hypothetical protein PHE53_10715 [Thermoguttaceae bacterium]|nr:hypothetical protein [Thermoguttaceae bacterium]
MIRFFRFYSVSICLTLLLSVVCGCSSTDWNEPNRPKGQALYENPMMIQYSDPLVLWETLADVIDDYFTIRYELPVRSLDGVVTDGRLVTFPQPGAGILEPWRGDSANLDERIRATVQSIRRYAEVAVTPVQGGFLIEVAVYKEIEDVLSAPQTIRIASSANVNATGNREALVGEAAANEGWVFLERDHILEQRILGHLTQRLGVSPILRGTTLPGVIDPGKNTANDAISAPSLGSTISSAAPTGDILPGPSGSGSSIGQISDPYTPAPSAEISTLPPPPPGSGMPPSAFSP